MALSGKTLRLQRIMTGITGRALAAEMQISPPRLSELEAQEHMRLETERRALRALAVLRARKGGQ